jgi:hypothetical protein
MDVISFENNLMEAGTQKPSAQMVQPFFPFQGQF